MHYGKLLALAGLVGIVSAEAGGSAYFYRRTMMRYNAKTERTMKMSGVDWDQYFSKMKECREWMMEQPHEDVWIRSEDSLKLHGTYFQGAGNVEEKKCKKAVICFHGYTSQGLADYGSISNYYLKRGYNVLLVDQRSHGQSEGKYIGFGCKDRYDAYRWIEWVIGQEGENVQILLHGNSMGGATVLMASGLDLPQQVKGIIADCPFTSPKAVFTHVLHSMYHLPAFPIIQIADAVNKKQAGYGLDECNSAREVRKAKVPVLLIHTGIGDVFGCLQTGTEKFCIAEKRGFQIIVFLVGQEVLLGQQHAHTYTLGTFVTVHRVTVGRVVRINAVGLAVINHIRPVAQVARIVHLLTIADKRYAFVHQIFYIIYYQ